MQHTANRTPAGVLALLNPIALVRNLWGRRELIEQFARRDVEGKFRSSFLGGLWSIVTPILMLAIYTFVFGVVFKSRWSQATGDSLAGFALILFAGLTTYEVFSETVVRAPSLVVSVPNYVKKVVFPLEVLPVGAVGAALFQAGMSYGVLVLANILVTGVLHWTALLLPVVLLPVVLLALGFSWFLASLGVFVRDISNLIGLLVRALLFLTPIFYDASTLAEPLRSLVRLNPLAILVDDARKVLIYGVVPDVGPLALSALAGLVVTVLGYAWFMKTKKAFADVI